MGLSTGAPRGRARRNNYHALSFRLDLPSQSWLQQQDRPVPSGSLDGSSQATSKVFTITDREVLQHNEHGQVADPTGLNGQDTDLQVEGALTQSHR